MKFHFTTVCKLTLDHAPGTKSSTHIATDIRLELSNNLDTKKYLNRGLPTPEGSKAMTMTLVAGLVANIHKAHAEGWRDSAEHLRYIIAELERGFSSVATVKEGEM